MTAVNQIALRIHEMSLQLEGSNMPEIVAALDIAAREIDRLAELEYNVVATLEGLGSNSIRVREGGGPENLAMSLAATAVKLEKRIDELRQMCDEVRGKLAIQIDAAAQQQVEIERLNGLINSPQITNFLEAVKLEAIHQRERWGIDHDAGKADADWFWLIGYLAGKALHASDKPPDAMNIDASPPRPIVTKQLHHIITTAAACLNWHAARTGEDTRMRPGIESPLEFGSLREGSTVRVPGVGEL